MDRRDFIKFCGSVIALGALAGCSKSNDGSEMSAAYKERLCNGDILSGGPFPDHDYTSGGKVRRYTPRTHTAVRRNEVNLQNAGISGVQPAQNSGHIQAYSRTKWHAKPIIASRMKPMNGVERITVHHEGNPQPDFSNSVAEVQKELYKIQKTHFKVLRAGDIAYHYIIDRAGRVWQGRDIRYQGAHAKHNNSHNIGIMCLGNFEIQEPTGSQVACLEQLCRALMTGYDIPANKLYGHRELRSTVCPGKNLFPYVKKIRATAV